MGADYFFQSQDLSDTKNSLGFKSKFLIWHGLIVFALSWILSFQLKFVLGAAVIAITHYLIDGVKARFNQHPKIAKYIYYVDQFLHVSIIVVVVCIFRQIFGFTPLFEMQWKLHHIAIATAYLVCLKPTNVFIKEVFYTWQLQISSTNELPMLENSSEFWNGFFTLTFILIGQFEAVGFLIAAKSVLRYRDDETLKTEYVLIGTMLSFGIAIFMGILAGLV